MTTLIAYDGSEDSQRAITVAARLLTAAPTCVVTVWEPLITQISSQPMSVATGDDAEVIDERMRADAESRAAEGAELARQAGLGDVTYRAAADPGTIWDALIAAADELDADVLVTGSRGLGGLKSLLLGSVSRNLLQHAARPVLVVPPQASAVIGSADRAGQS